ncbi:DgyrCDS10376 [Dimorphilus gyrociliatus]|nr:DgyrCDS10376 [Dimorphilus gyrociliatus]
MTSNKVNVQMIVTDQAGVDVDKLQYRRPAYVAVGFVLALTAFVVLFPALVNSRMLGMKFNVFTKRIGPRCDDSYCKVELVESIPENVTFNETVAHLSTFNAWKTLITKANKTIKIASCYWSLTSNDTGHFHFSSAWQGEEILKLLKRSLSARKINVEIVTDAQSYNKSRRNLEELAKLGAKVRRLDMKKLLNSSGILHTKMWIIDDKHAYVGSANMDWRSLTEVKELGVLITNCSCMIKDLVKNFIVYWKLAVKDAVIPVTWPTSLSTLYDIESPMVVSLRGMKDIARLFFTNSPQSLCPRGRTNDIYAIVSVINRARKFVYISVMDYHPLIEYRKPELFWPVIDNALRKVALENFVEIRLLISRWRHTRKDMYHFLKSLKALNGIENGADKVKFEVKLFEVPVSKAQEKIPYARVNHNKYMITDNAAFIGTSNWSGDYFTNTAGTSLIVNQTRADGTIDVTTVQKQLLDIFTRDWNSRYAVWL